MSDPTSLDEPDSPPPPAYELSQQDFDQKTSHVIETSHAEASTSRIVEENGEEWQVWDDAALKTAVANLAIGEGSSSTKTSEPPSVQSTSGKGKLEDSTAHSMLAGNVQPLRIVKKSNKSLSPPPKEKERPSWFKEAQLDQNSPISDGTASQTALLPGAALSRSGTMYSYRERTPPPMFEAVGPSFDGPPYQEATIVMTYNPGSTASRPASPLYSPPYQTQPLSPLGPSSPISPTTSISSRRSLPPPPPISAASPPPTPSAQRVPSPPSTRSNAAAHRSMPAPARPIPQVNRRPMTAYNTAHDIVGPRVAFNPQVAYMKKSFGLPEEPIPRMVDPASFYSSAVSSHVSPNTSGLPRSSMTSMVQPSRPGSLHVAQPIPTPALRTPSPLLHSTGGYQSGSMPQNYTTYPSQLSTSMSTDSNFTFQSPTMSYPSSATNHTTSSNPSYFSSATSYSSPMTYSQHGNIYPTPATPATTYSASSNNNGNTTAQGYGTYGQTTPQPQQTSQYNTSYGTVGQQNWTTPGAYNQNQYTRPW